MQRSTIWSNDDASTAPRHGLRTRSPHIWSPCPACLAISFTCHWWEITCLQQGTAVAGFAEDADRPGDELLVQA